MKPLLFPLHPLPQHAAILSFCFHVYNLSLASVFEAHCLGFACTHHHTFRFLRPLKGLPFNHRSGKEAVEMSGRLLIIRQIQNPFSASLTPRNRPKGFKPPQPNQRSSSKVVTVSLTQVCWISNPTMTDSPAASDDQSR